MRISSASIYSLGAYDMSNLQASLQKQQLQLDNQTRIVTPSDDPVAATEILQLDESSGRNDQFKTNSQTAQSQLSFASTAVQNATNLVTEIQTLAIQAGNASLAAPQRLDMQSELAQKFAALISNANATDGSGIYLFGGNQLDRPPFVADPAMNVTYQGDTGQRQLAITDSQTVPISEAGTQVFGDPSNPPTVFSNIQALSNLLQQDPKPSTYDSQLSSIISGLADSQTQIQTAGAAIGAQQQAAQVAETTSTSLDDQFQQAIANLQGLDMPKAISQFTITRTSLQYAQQAYVKVTGMSLFNYIN